LQESENNFSGPITKRSSFTFDLSRNAVENGSERNGARLDPKSVRRAPLTRVDIHDQGIGAFDLKSRGYHLMNHYDTAQAVETSVHGTTVNETRFQFYRWGYSTTSNTAGAAIQVLGAFNGGAAAGPHNRDLQRAYEFQNNTSIVHGAHVFRFGARSRF